MKALAKNMLARGISLGNRFIPKRRQLVLNSFPDVEDQLVAVLRWLHREQSSLPVVLLVGGSVSAARTKLHRLIGPGAASLSIRRKTSPYGVWAYWRSSHVFFTHGLYGFPRVAEPQCVVNLWHGMPLKRMWLGKANSIPPPCTWLLSTSSRYTEVLAEAAGVPPAIIPALGLPRNDLLFSSTPAVTRFREAAHRDAARVLFFLPTYRSSKVGFLTHDGHETGDPLGMTAGERQALRAHLAETRTRLIVKPHPMSVNYGRDLLADPWLWVISDDWLHRQGLTLYEALGQMDGLVTDISSVYVDFLMLNRPVFFFFPDFTAYRDTRSFQLDPVEEWLAGPVCSSGDQLIGELKKFAAGHDDHLARRRELAAVCNPHAGAGATERLFSFLGLHEGGGADRRR